MIRVSLGVAMILLLTSTAICKAEDFRKKTDQTSGYTQKEVWMAYDGFNKTFLDSNKYIYKTDTSFEQAIDRGNGAAAIWCQPIYWEMAMNAYKLAKSEKDKRRTKEMRKLCEKIFAGNKAHYAHFDFDDNNENTGWFIYDDIMWWTIALSRAYELFGEEEYLRLAEASFKRVWYGSDKVGDTGSYDEEDGGMFWQWQPIRNPNPNKPGDGKMACINFPTVVAALTLYNNVPEGRPEQTGQIPECQSKRQYLAKGKEVYEWGVENLLDQKTGRVADSRHGKGAPNWKAHVYNQATFYCIKLQVKNAIWIMRSWQLTILSMRCLLRNIYYLLSMESSKVFILLFLLSTLLCWYMIADRLNIFHICTAIFVPVGPTGMKYVAFVAVSIPKHCQPM